MKKKLFLKVNFLNFYFKENFRFMSIFYIGKNSYGKDKVTINSFILTSCENKSDCRISFKIDQIWHLLSCL